MKVQAAHDHAVFDVFDVFDDVFDVFDVFDVLDGTNGVDLFAVLDVFAVLVLDAGTGNVPIFLDVSTLARVAHPRGREAKGCSRPCS